MERKQPMSLEKRQLPHFENNKWQLVSALDPEVWCAERSFPQYMAPPVTPDGNFPMGAKESWLELVELICEELTWLLELPHHCFWSQVIHDKSVMFCLTSFLQEAPPVYCMKTYPKDVHGMLDKISKLVFVIYKRLVTAKEGQEEFISPDILGEIWYENYIFTVPSMLDLCVLYGQSNADEVRNMLKYVTDLQPGYLQDFVQAVPPFIEIFENITSMVTEDSKSSRNVEDKITHVFDSLVTMRTFCEVFPRGCEIFATTEVVAAVASFYTTLMPNLAKRTHMQQLTANLRLECQKFVRKLLQHVLSEAMETGESSKVEIYLSLISEIMSEDLFICDYHALYQLESDFDIVANVCPELDPMKLDYLMEALASHKEIKLKKKDKPAPPVNHKVNYPQASTSQQRQQPSSSKARNIGQVELISLISHVNDILPHLGTGFIEECLKYYDYDPEKVISAYLENTLPASIEEQDWSKERPPVPERSNDYDFDEFDTKTGAQVQKTRVFKGKKPREYKNVNQMLSDKRELAGIRDKMANLGYVEDEYDDEYDDTYDSQDVAVKEPDAVTARGGRQFVTPRVLQTREAVEEEEETEEEDAAAEAIRKDHFVPNPEELRAKAEERRAQGRGQRDVVGRGRGQGQEKQVLINRQRKNTNKSGVANHHRRDRASKKRNQGMIPS